jgi:hypothetical protein
MMQISSFLGVEEEVSEAGFGLEGVEYNGVLQKLSGLLHNPS